MTAALPPYLHCKVFLFELYHDRVCPEFHSSPTKFVHFQRDQYQEVDEILSGSTETVCTISSAFHPLQLEERQRQGERVRKENNAAFPTKVTYISFDNADSFFIGHFSNPRDDKKMFERVLSLQHFHKTGDVWLYNKPLQKLDNKPLQKLEEHSASQ